MKPRLGIIGGSGLSHSGFLKGVEDRHPETPYGEPSGPLEMGQGGELAVAFLARHGQGQKIPPHRVNHRANLWALKEAGVEGVVSTSSVGSLKLVIKPGDLLVPDDYLSPWSIPTFHDDEVIHVTPELDADLRATLVKAAQETGVRTHQGGVYVQTIGPRLETKAEIRMLQQFGDVVGMTVASEATLAQELDLPYASLCTIDNYCHGLVELPLLYDEIVKVQELNAKILRKVLEALSEEF